MAAGEQETVHIVWDVLESTLSEQRYELVEVEVVRQGRSCVLRLFVDKDGGVTLDDCTAVSQLVSPILDRADFIQGKYFLEVSSPGFDRPVRKARDFERFAGEAIKVKTHMALAGRKKYTGVLRGLRDGMVIVECDGVEHEIHIENVQKANLIR